MPDARKYFPLSSPFAMKRGGELHGALLAYETWGTLSVERDNAILILTGLSPSAHAASNMDDPAPGWWQEMLGPGKPIDTDRWFVICANTLGSCKGLDRTGVDESRHWRDLPASSFPELSLEDAANAAHELVAGLGIDRLACLIGNSMGGMTALATSSCMRRSARSHISISTAAQAQPFAIAIRSLQREAIRLDPDWNLGRYDDDALSRCGHEHRAQAWRDHLSIIDGVGGSVCPHPTLDSEQRDDEPFSAGFRSSRIWMRMPGASCATLIPMPTCSFHGRVTGSILPNTATVKCCQRARRDQGSQHAGHRVSVPTSFFRCRSRRKLPKDCAMVVPK